MSDAIRGARARRPSFAIVTALVVSVAPLLVLVVPAVLHLPAVEPLLHESEFFPGFSRATLVAVTLVGLVTVNLAIAAATRSMRGTLVPVAITTALAVLIVLGAVGFVEQLDAFFGGVD